MLTVPFGEKGAPCEVDCRDPALLAAIKGRLSDSNTFFSKGTASLKVGPTRCEYTLTKQSGNTTTDTTVVANFAMDPAPETCTFALKDVKEFAAEDHDTETNNTFKWSNTGKLGVKKIRIKARGNYLILAEVQAMDATGKNWAQIGRAHV